MSTLPNAHALLVGIANYQQINRLPVTVLQDVRDIHTLLVDEQHCGYAPENVQMLLNGEATLAGLYLALAELAEHTDADSTVLIYMSMHGGRITQGEAAGEYLLPVDVELRTIEDALEVDPATALSSNEFSTALCAEMARNAVVIFDCCHAGGIGQAKGVEAAFKSGLSDALYVALAAGRGRAILASSRHDELSWILPGDQNSLFTKHLLAGLRGDIPSSDGLIRIFDLFEYIQPKVTGDYSAQHPIFKAELEENFPVALALGGQKQDDVTVQPDAEKGTDDFRYDAYISYVDQGADATYVWDKLVPQLEKAGLRVAVSGDVEEPGVARVVNVERGIRLARRTVVALSPPYLADHMADFENTLAQTLGIQEGFYRLLPVIIEPLEEAKLPTRIGMLTRLDLTHPQRAARNMERMLESLNSPLPVR
ncbi:caspase family protein [Chloroflexi bacterium TSY]|nr:caspase family protein [Chloroflexi bacterium TSY]